MTDELLELVNGKIQWITNRLELLTRKIDNYEGNEQTHLREKKKLRAELEPWLGLRVVLGLHNRMLYTQYPLCMECSGPDNSVVYPCHTRQAIEGVLK